MNKRLTPAEVFIKYKWRNKNAFTLAEVLITLGIIGVVAAMTLPTVINTIQDKQFKAAFKKEYSAISQAMLSVYANENTVYEQVEWQNMAVYVCKVAKQLKTVKSGLKCNDILAAKGPISDLVKLWQPNVISWYNSNYNKIQWYNKQKQKMESNSAFHAFTFALPDGAVINFNSVNQIFIDVNGFKKPNTIGKDIFYCFLPNGESTPTFFKKNGDATSVNGYACPNYCTDISPENYIEDCKHGTGWGCSPMYILD